MSQNLIDSKKRDMELNPRQLRMQGLVPATVYGKAEESISVQLNSKEFMIAYKKDKNSIFSLKMESATIKAIVKKVQVEATTDKVLNVEFQRIKDAEKIKVVVNFETVGDSPAVKAGASITMSMSSVEVECLPGDIPHSISVDISKLVNYEDVLTIAEIDFPNGVSPLVNTDSLVVKVNAPKEAKK